jgi:hypothetical protein
MISPLKACGRTDSAKRSITASVKINRKPGRYRLFGLEVEVIGNQQQFRISKVGKIDENGTRTTRIFTQITAE